ncbi:MAG: hypothetical protein WDO56_34960 [Gammaproteobacteria bacterium]
MYTETLGTGTHDGFARLVDWCHALLGEHIGVQQWGGSKDQYTLTLKEGPELTFRREPTSKACSVESGEPLPPRILSILRDASVRATRGDAGKTQWWQVVFVTRKLLNAAFGLHMMRMLGQTRAFTGLWRLGADALAEFTVDDPKQLVAFAKQNIKVTFRCVGPGHGPRSAEFARKHADVIRTVLAFCTASGLEGSPIVKTVNDPAFPPGGEVDRTLPELSIQGLGIWTRLTEAASTGAVEVVSRAVNALTAYEHALNQPTDAASTVFFVAAIEALTVPNHRYAHLRVTSRFVQSLLALAGPKLDETLKHANFTEAFETDRMRVRTPTALANRIYALRSSPIHTGGFGLERDAMFRTGSVEGPIRSALLAEIAESAIVEFLKCPFSSLIGHMDFDPACRIELTEDEHAAVLLAARAKGQSIEDYILLSLGLSRRKRR